MAPSRRPRPGGPPRASAPPRRPSGRPPPRCRSGCGRRRRTPPRSARSSAAARAAGRRTRSSRRRGRTSSSRSGCPRRRGSRGSGSRTRCRRPRVLLDHRVGDAGLSQADAGEQPRHAGPDDHHAEGRLRLGGHRVERRHPAGVGPVELELLEHHRHVLVGDLLRHEEVHHLVHDLGRGRRREHAPAVAVGPDDVEGRGPCGRLVLGAHEPLHLVEVDARGAAAHPGGSTGRPSCGPSRAAAWAR